MNISCKASIIVICCITFALAQAPDTLWTKTYGGINFDVGEEILQTPDSGFIITGYTALSDTNHDVWLLKTNNLGDTLWTKTYGGAYQDWGNSTTLTYDGGYAVTGCIEVYGIGWNLWLLKTDSLGDTLWTKTYGGSSGSNMGKDIKQTQDSGYIIIGYTSLFGAGYDDVWLLRTDSNGDTLWTRTYGGSGSDEGISGDFTMDGGYIIVGYTDSYGAGNGDIWLIKTNALGDTDWTKTYGGANTDYGSDVIPTLDGGYIVLGVINTFQDIWLLKTDSLGDTLWTKIISSGYYNEAYSVKQTADDGYIIAGYTGTTALAADGYLVKTDVLGNIEWTKTLGGSNDDFLRSVDLTFDGGYIASGCTYSYGVGDADLWLIKMGPDTLGIIDNRTKYSSIFDWEIFPNPMIRECNIRYVLAQNNRVAVTVYDITGRQVKEIINENQNAGVHYTKFTMIDLPQGVYFIKLDTKSDAVVKKVILVK